MRYLLAGLTTLFLIVLVAGCQEGPNQQYIIESDGNGKLVRLNVETGETCYVGDSCDSDLTALVIGESYVYRGNGEFQKQEVVKWKDLH